MIWNPMKSAKVFSSWLSIFSILLLPVVLFSAERAKNIPGIDPLPLASGSDNVTQNQTNPTQNTQLQQTSTDLGFPKIRNITVVPEPTQPFTAKISWDLYPDSTTPIYVVRYSKPISTKELLLEAYNLTSPPLKAGSTVLLNRDLPEGVYYYAAVTAFELSTDGRVDMRAGQNYTVSPFIVYRDGQSQPNLQTDHNPTNSERNPNLQPEDFYIRSINAINYTNGVVLNWPALNLRGIEYEVFRSIEPLDSNERIEKAVRLGTVREDTPFFTDESAIEGKQVYYGVSVHDKITNKNYRDLKYQLSYITHTYRKPTQEFRYDSFLPESLIAFLAGSNTIQLIWADPGPTVTSYRVYRNKMPISSTQLLEASEQIGIATPNSGGFKDTKLATGTYFYALLPNTTSGEQLSVLQPGRTFTAFGVSIRSAATDKPEEVKETEIKKEDDVNSKSVIKDLNVKSNGLKVQLIWNVVNKEKINRVTLYRSTQPIKTLELANEIGKIVDDAPTPDQELNDSLSRPGSYYYGVYEYDPKSKEAIEYYSVVNPIKITEDDVLNNHDNIQIENQNQPSNQEEEYLDKSLEEILSSFFAKEKFKEAETRLEAYLGHSQALNRSKAKFYLGITKFKLGKYAEAKKIFEDPLSIAHDRERASFWYRVSMERANR